MLSLSQLKVFYSTLTSEVNKGEINGGSERCTTTGSYTEAVVLQRDRGRQKVFGSEGYILEELRDDPGVPE